jgi:hypothetical protein
VPPYTPNVSQSQQRKMFALAHEGKISQAEAEGKARATNWKGLPQRVKSKRVSARPTRVPMGRMTGR